MSFDVNIDVDIAIVVGFLAINLVVGLIASRGVSTIKEYAVGNKKMGTAFISSTIIATWISGSFFTVSVSQTYKNGVWFIPAALGDIISLLIIGYILAPRMKKFLNHISVAETMGELYGNRIRMVTAIASLAQATAMTALQIKVFSSVFSYFLEFSTVTATLISSFVVVFYAAWGGIKAVTFTDALQFFTFGVFIPMFALFIWQIFGNTEVVYSAFHSNPLLDFTELLNYNDPRFLPNFSMLLWFLIPSLSSPTFQRILMAKNTNQIMKSFIVAALGYTFIMFFICVIGLLVLALEPTLDPNNLVVHIVTSYSFTGLKGITLIGIMAMVMSTADSWINIGSVIFSHDICKPMGIKAKDELVISRIFAIIIGVGAVLLVLSSSSLFKLFSLQANFYMPIVTMPLILAILGFRTTPMAIGMGMVAGFISVILWKSFLSPLTGIDSVVPSMFTNLFTFLGAHYILKQDGGWQNEEVDKKKAKLVLVHKFSFDSIVEYCKRYEPKNTIVYSYFAFGVLFTMLVTFSLDREIYIQNFTFVNCIQGIALLISTLFFTHDLIWPKQLKHHYIGIIWFVSIFICLSLISSMMVLVSRFSEISLVIYIIHISAIGILLNWRTTFYMILFGLIMSYTIYGFYVENSILYELHNFKLKIMYTLFILGSFILAFIKPQQEYIKATEERVSELETETAALRRENGHAKREILNMAEGVEYFHAQLGKQKEESSAKTKKLASTIRELRNELLEVDNLKDEFLRNLQHESNTPLTAVISKSNILFDSYDSLDSDTIKASIKDIINGSERLQSYVSNLVDTSKLTENAGSKLDKVIRVNLSKLVEERTKSFKKVFSDDKNKPRFKLDIEPDLMVECNEHYITQLLDNLISNADKYGENSVIEISLSKMNSIMVEFKITDHGIGIPKDEVYDIFKIFTNSSRTHSQAEGRGLGLALCHKVVEAHQGKIIAESDGEKGATFTFVIPFNYHFKGVKI